MNALSPENLRQTAPVTEAPLKRHVFVCTGKSCATNDSQATLEAFQHTLAEKGLLYGKRGRMDGPVILTACGSVGLCSIGPAVLVYPDGIWYYRVYPQDVAEIVEKHLIHGETVERLLAKRIP